MKTKLITATAETDNEFFFFLPSPIFIYSKVYHEIIIGVAIFKFNFFITINTKP